MALLSLTYGPQFSKLFSALKAIGRSSQDLESIGFLVKAAKLVLGPKRGYEADQGKWYFIQMYLEATAHSINLFSEIVAETRHVLKPCPEYLSVDSENSSHSTPMGLVVASFRNKCSVSSSCLFPARFPPPQEHSVLD